MKVLSIDIGIKNLALTILEHTSQSSNFQIIKWDVISLCNIVPNCSTCNCKCAAKFSKKEKFFCKKHTKNEEYKIPTINTKTLPKQNMKNITILAEENGIEFDKSTNKTELVKRIIDHVENTCFEPIETINANNVNLIDLGINLKTELNKLFSTSTIDPLTVGSFATDPLTIDLSLIDLIILENQISPLAGRMKTLQGMIAQYFIDKNNYNIEFMSAANKLKIFVESSKKTSYAERKKLSILYTKQLLSNKNMDNELDFFVKHKKKDDLADCLLQGIYYLSTFNKLNLSTFNKLNL